MTTRTKRTEGVVQVVILLTVGGVAAAASFTHVHDVAAAHRQPGWLAWADAVVLEMMSIANGLRVPPLVPTPTGLGTPRRPRPGRPTGFVVSVLVAAVVLSLAAQVVQAEPSIV